MLSSVYPNDAGVMFDAVVIMLFRFKDCSVAPAYSFVPDDEKTDDKICAVFAARA